MSATLKTTFSKRLHMGFTSAMLPNELSLGGKLQWLRSSRSLFEKRLTQAESCILLRVEGEGTAVEKRSYQRWEQDEFVPRDLELRAQAYRACLTSLGLSESEAEKIQIWLLQPPQVRDGLGATANGSSLGRRAAPTFVELQPLLTPHLPEGLLNLEFDRDAAASEAALQIKSGLSELSEFFRALEGQEDRLALIFTTVALRYVRLNNQRFPKDTFTVDFFVFGPFPLIRERWPVEAKALSDQLPVSLQAQILETDYRAELSTVHRELITMDELSSRSFFWVVRDSGFFAHAGQRVRKIQSDLTPYEKQLRDVDERLRRAELEQASIDAQDALWGEFDRLNAIVNDCRDDLAPWLEALSILEPVHKEVTALVQDVKAREVLKRCRERQEKVRA